VDFFERQDKARRNTTLLVFYFALAIICLVSAVDLAVALIFGVISVEDSTGQPSDLWTALNVMSAATIGTLAIISVGSVSKTLQLSSGSAVAELLDGRLISSNTTDLNERRLLDVVEEMSIASGVPVPQVFVMEEENGINAFAAGHSPSDAAISVTRGALRYLSRDELQGIIAHEFSHILNGDMRLNVRLMGLIFGILCLTVIGRVLIRTRGRKNPLPLLGFALIIIGWAGVFFGRLIQAAVSRQRECLADASSVQFTRNPSGLAGALKKIGALEQGSRLESPHAEEASHLFFANGMKEPFFGLMATHPPLIERIRELDPSFDGKFPTHLRPISEPDTPPPAAPLAAATKMVEFAAATAIAQQAVVASIGQPATRHLRYATDFQQAISPALSIAARDPLSSTTLVYAFLLGNESSTRTQQLNDLANATSDAVRDETVRIWSAAQHIPPHVKIPLLDLALPALRRLSPPQFEEFRSVMKKLTPNQNDLFAYMLQKIVSRHLDTHFFPQGKAVIQFYSLRGLNRECGVLLSAIAQVGQRDPAETQRAFAEGAKMLSRAAGCDVPWLPPDQCTLSDFDSALERLSQALPQIKKNVLDACAQTVAADNLIQEPEAELLRAIADSLDCPIPPFVLPEEEISRLATKVA
jgi:Zn-dependent protease with chaperone function